MSQNRQILPLISYDDRQRFEPATALESEIFRLESHFSRLGAEGPAELDAAVATARSCEDAGLLGRALCLQARAHIFRGRIPQGIETAEAAISALASLSGDEAAELAGVLSEALRTAGRACFKLGMLKEALPRLEQAVAVAERGLAHRAGSFSVRTLISPATAVVRALHDLGVAFIAVGEVEEAIETYARAVASADAHPEVYRLVPDDVLLSLTGWAEALQQRHSDQLAQGGDSGEDLAMAGSLLATRARALIDNAERLAASADATPLSGYGYQSYWGALGRQMLLTGDHRAAIESYGRKIAHGAAVGNAAVCGRGEVGLAIAHLAIGDPDAAVAHATAAISRLGEDDEAQSRAEALMTLSKAHRALGDYKAALEALQSYNAVCDFARGVDARRSAIYLSRKISLERARAEADAQRRIATDLTRLNAKLEAQAAILGRQAADLKEAQAAAEAADRTKSVFLANMSHELRTPLNAIIGFSEFMRSGLAGAPQQSWIDYAGYIHDAGSHLLGIVNDVLDLSRVEAGCMEVDADTVVIAELFADCLRFVSVRAEASGVALAAAPEGGPETIRTDHLRLRQILLNLLTNAVKFTPQGGSVELRARWSEGGVILSVTDTGCGMTDPEIEIALQPFKQVENSLSRKSEGTGLGLPLSKKLAELLGGTLSIVSAPGRGTVVEIRLPPGVAVDSVAATAQA